MMRILSSLLALILLSGCARRPASPGISYFVAKQCNVSARLIDCDQASPPRHCRKIALDYDRYCEQIVAGSSR